MSIELNRGEILKREYNERKAKARHYEIKEALDRFTLWVMQMANMESLSDKGCGKLVKHLGSLRKRVLRNSRANAEQNLRASESIKKLQMGIHSLKAKIKSQ